MSGETIADIIAEKRARANEIERDVAAKMVSVEMVTDQYAREVIADLRREADRIEAAAKRERDDMLDVLVRIGNWCAQDLAENAYLSDSSGNYLKTLNGLCEVCRPFMKEAIRLKRYGGTE